MVESSQRQSSTTRLPIAVATAIAGAGMLVSSHTPWTSADFTARARTFTAMAKCQSADGSFLHRHDMDGNLGASWGFLQPDETGSVVYGVWQHLALSDNKDLAVELRDMIDRATDWLVNSKHSFDSELPIEGHDLWEERIGVHYYAVGAMAAGIEAGIKIYEYMGWDVPQNWTASFENLKSLVHSDRFLKKDGDRYFFARTLLRTVDNQGRLNWKPEALKVKPHKQNQVVNNFT